MFTKQYILMIVCVTLTCINSQSDALSNTCIKISPSQHVEQRSFRDLIDNGINVIFFNLTFYGSENETFLDVEKRRRWVWIVKDQQYVLGYPEDVDVFSFGLLKAKQDSLKVNISIGNFSADCKLHFDRHLSKYLQFNIIDENVTDSNENKEIPVGQLCHSNIESYDKVSEFIINLSGVKIGYHFSCLTENNEFEVVGKSYVNVIVIIIILFLYAFYPLIIEMAFYTHSTNYKEQFYEYYKSDSPYSPSRFLLRLIYTGRNKYFAALRIIILVIALTTFVYLAKSTVYDKCHCSLKSSNDEGKFQHAENYYMTTERGIFIAIGVFNFVLLSCCVLINSNGTLDDFLIVDLSNVCKNGQIFRLIPVYVFLLDETEEETVEKSTVPRIEMPNDDETKENTQSDKSLVSFKILKLSLILSYKFWTKIFLIRSVDVSVSWAYFTSIIVFPLNFILVFLSAICPIVSFFYIFLIKFLKCICSCCSGKKKYKYQSLDKLNLKQKGIQSAEETGESEEGGKKSTIFEKTEKSSKEKVSALCCDLLCHGFASSYIITSYVYSFNIFFYGISYLVQFFIYTVLLALPHYPVQIFIYIIFVTSVIVYLSRYVHQFIELYKNLLNEILEITEESSISIQDFNKIVAEYFPLKHEIFYLLLKIILTSLFFIIIFDTMQKVEYIKIGARLDVTTVVSLIFVFGPPRIVEELLVTDFTSRVHAKKKEIKKYIGKPDRDKRKIIHDDRVLDDTEKDCSTCCSRSSCKCLDIFDPKEISVSYDEEKVLCENSKICGYSRCCCALRVFCNFSCGCFNCPIDSQRRCDFCYVYAIDETSDKIEVNVEKIKLQCHCYPSNETQKEGKRSTPSAKTQKQEAGTEDIMLNITSSAEAKKEAETECKSKIQTSSAEVEKEADTSL